MEDVKGVDGGARLGADWVWTGAWMEDEGEGDWGWRGVWMEDEGEGDWVWSGVDKGVDGR